MKKAKILTLNNNHENNKEIAETASDLLKNGKIIISPTDTIYGILADYENKQAVSQIYEIKNRPADKRFIVLLSSIEQVENISLAKIDNQVKSLLPAPLTLIVNNRLKKLYNEKTLAVRYPNDDFLLRLLTKTNRYIVAPSANISGEKNIVLEKEIVKKFEDKVDLIILNGDLKQSEPSTILDITKKPYRILREGRFKVPEKILKETD